MEQQTCPRRMGEAGPWEYKENLDLWVTTRWSTDREATVKKHAEEDARLPPNSKIHRGPNSDLWLWSWGPPRTCNFCGSCHPDDVLKLLEEGWENEKAKEYKGYLNPPGYATQMQAFLASIRDRGREPGQGVPSVWSPIPPVKFYIQHFNKDQLAKLNELLSR